MIWPYVRGLIRSLRPARCCNCRAERDQALMELAQHRATQSTQRLHKPEGKLP